MDSLTHYFFEEIVLFPTGEKHLEMFLSQLLAPSFC